MMNNASCIGKIENYAFRSIFTDWIKIGKSRTNRVFANVIISISVYDIHVSAVSSNNQLVEIVDSILEKNT